MIEVSLKLFKKEICALDLQWLPLKVCHSIQFSTNIVRNIHLGILVLKGMKTI